jgi:hypothetical protein
MSYGYQNSSGKAAEHKMKVQYPTTAGFLLPVYYFPVYYFSSQ